MLGNCKDLFYRVESQPKLGVGFIFFAVINGILFEKQLASHYARKDDYGVGSTLRRTGAKER
jgi:hypothetical protein